MSDALANLFRDISRQWTPPPDWTVSQWADRTRRLSSESSAEPGQWRTSRAEYQRGIMDAVNDAKTEQVVVMSSAQVGKALDIETPIPTPEGWKKMGDLVVGDCVFDETGQPCRVTFVTPTMHDRTCYRVTFSDGSALVADTDHQWTVHNDIGTKSQFRVETKTTAALLKDYKAGRRNRYAIPTAKPIVCERLRLPIDPYLLGVWLGDGHSYSTGITVSNKDRAEMERLINACGYACKAQPEGNNWTLRVDPFLRSDGELCFGLSKDLRAAGLMEKGRSAKHIPQEYLRASINQRLALLQGLMDTDGTIGSNGRCEFVTTSQPLADGFKELIASLGFKAVMATKIPTTTYNGEKVNGAKAYRFSFIAYQDTPVFRLCRKRARQPGREGRRTTETGRRRIVAITEVESVPVRCIQVDSLSHLYLAGRDFIPTHNTEAVNNVVGYHIDFDPCPMLVVQPTLDMAETWSKDRLTPMLRDTPEIGQKVTGKSRKSQNKILHKSFPGGHVTIAGANAPASLASRPVRLVLCDEVDRYPASAGTEGDPVNLAIKRTSTFWNRKILLVSTPTIKGHSRIEDAFEQTDKRFFHIPCPHCGTMHRLQWANVRWKDDEPKSATFACPHCDARYTTAQKNAAVRRGEWVATARFRGKAGFHLSELYSPWRQLHETVADFLEAKGSPEKLQVWINTCLGETWEEGGKILDENELMGRREAFQAEVPARALILTAGVDVQPDRLELAVVGWGAGEESWSVDYHVIHGDPDIPEGSPGSPWTDLTDYLRQQWQHESGQPLIVSYTFIDSGGSNTQAVYNYVKRHKGGRVFAIKGRGGEGVPIVGAPNRKRSGKQKRSADLYIVGVDNAKAVVTKRLEIESPGPGYCHFPAERDVAWFRGLTAETMVTKMVKGRPKREWKVIEGRRNEPLDCRVYAFAALVMASPQFDKIALRMKRRTQTMKIEKPTQKPAPEAPKPEPTPQDQEAPAPDNRPKKPKPPRSRGSFINRWRN